MTNKSRILRIGYADYMGRVLTREAAEQMVKEGNNVQNVKKLYKNRPVKNTKSLALL